jgi:hypothetical protein
MQIKTKLRGGTLVLPRRTIDDPELPPPRGCG